MGTARALVVGSGEYPACKARVLNPRGRSILESGIRSRVSKTAGPCSLSTSAQYLNSILTQDREHFALNRYGGLRYENRRHGGVGGLQTHPVARLQIEALERGLHPVQQRHDDV